VAKLTRSNGGILWRYDQTLQTANSTLKPPPAFNLYPQYHVAYLSPIKFIFWLLYFILLQYGAFWVSYCQKWATANLKIAAISLFA